MEPPATPINGSSPFKQTPYSLIFSKDYGWFWIIELLPILDVVIKEGGVREQSITVDLPIGAEKNKPQYLGFEDDMVLLRIRGTLDSIRQIDYLNRDDYITIRRGGSSFEGGKIC